MCLPCRSQGSFMVASPILGSWDPFLGIMPLDARMMHPAGPTDVGIF